MKKNENILKQLRIREEKHGICYAKTNGILYRRLHTVFWIFAVLNIILNIVIISGQYLISKQLNGDFKTVFKLLIIATAGLFVSLIIGFWYKKKVMQIITSVTGVISSVTLGVVYAIVLTDAKGPDNISVKGLDGKYYLHAILLLTVAVCLVWSVVIIVREAKKTNNAYRLMTDRIYKQYQKQVSDMTDSEFNEFLSNYDPKYEIIRKKREKQGYNEYENVVSENGDEN